MTDYQTALTDLDTENFLRILSLTIDIDSENQLQVNEDIIIIDVQNPLHFADVFTKEESQRRKNMSSGDLLLDDATKRENEIKFFRKLNIVLTFGRWQITSDKKFLILKLNHETYPIFKKTIKKIYKESYQTKYPIIPPKVCFLNNLPTITQDSSARKSRILYTISFTEKNEIFINNDKLLSKPHFDKENAKVFRFLYEHPNKTFKKKQIEEHLGHSVGKSLHKIVDNLKFKNNIRRLFFSITEESIRFTNPITYTYFKELKMPALKINNQRKKSKTPA